MANKNPCGKMRDKSKPYEIWEGNGWKWLVLKKWQADDFKPHARFFCFVTSPFCPEGEYGDVWAHEIRAQAKRTYIDPALKEVMATS
jgi:hypothetical protein